ncbi:DNA primase DnaG [Candidatus Poseidoniaceae archaeon]|nr:DNA primase DnaG [Candidatus Poseidoniaceae archaeon]
MGLSNQCERFSEHKEIIKMAQKRNNRDSGHHQKQKAMKYLIRADIKVNGSVQRKDIIGAIMGQTEGLLGDELEIRKLQRTARIGHVDVEIESKGGKVHGVISVPSSMDNVETAIIASALETIDRIGPCAAVIKVIDIQDVRATKRTTVVDRAKELLLGLVNSGEAASKTVIEEVRSVLTTGTATSFHGLTSGPNVESSTSLIIVEGRNDVRNLLNCGVKNAISADGAGDMKQELIDLANSKETVILAIDGDRGGEMLFSQLIETLKVDFVAQAPVGQEWELLPQKTVTKCLSMKVDATKFSHVLKKKQESDSGNATKDKNWAEDMPEEFVVEEAPAEVQEFFDHLDNITSKKAVFMMVDGTVSDEVGASTLAKKANEADGAIAMIVNGPVSERTLEIASEAAIPTVIGTKAGKGFAAREDVKAWLSEEHR